MHVTEPGGTELHVMASFVFDLSSSVESHLDLKIK